MELGSSARNWLKIVMTTKEEVQALTTYFAIFLSTNMSPGAAPVINDSGTRESEHPIQTTCAFPDF